MVKRLLWASVVAIGGAVAFGLYDVMTQAIYLPCGIWWFGC